MLWTLVVTYFVSPALFPAFVLAKQLFKGDVI
jgi:hypothetical protein